MAGLRNSQRISYKATYNQISPAGTVAQRGQARPLLRAVEKAAFIQPLQVNDTELAELERVLGGSAAGATDAALAAIRPLVTDNTGMTS